MLGTPAVLVAAMAVVGALAMTAVAATLLRPFAVSARITNAAGRVASTNWSDVTKLEAAPVNPVCGTRCACPDRIINPAG